MPSPDLRMCCPVCARLLKPRGRGAAQGVSKVKRDTSTHANGLAGSAAMSSAGGSSVRKMRTHARRDQPLTEQAAPGSAGSRNVPMSSGARPPRLAAGRLQHALPAPGVNCGRTRVLRLNVSCVKLGDHVLCVSLRAPSKMTGCCLRPSRWQAL